MDWGPIPFLDAAWSGTKIFGARPLAGQNEHISEKQHLSSQPPLNAAPDVEGFGPGDDELRKRCGGISKRQIQRAAKIAKEGSSLFRDVVSHGATKHRITLFKSIEHSVNRDRALDFQQNLRA